MNETREKQDKEKLLRSQKRWYRFYYSIVCVVALIFYPHKFRGRENIPEGPAIICAPHSNFMDPLLVSIAMGRKHFVHHMAKEELMHSALASFFMRKAGSVFIRRGAPDIEAFKQCIRVLKDGEKLMIFPEGTRVRDPEMGSFKPGAVRLAQKLQVPVLPVYITRNKKLFRHMDVVFGEPYLVPRDKSADADALSEDLRQRILALEPR